MPEGEGGTLSDQQYLDVLAYMLQENGYDADDRALAVIHQALDRLSRKVFRT